MASFFAELRPLALNQWWLIQQKPIQLLSRHIIIPAIPTLIAIFLSYLFLVSGKNPQLRKDPIYHEALLNNSLVFQDCFNASVVPSPCAIGIAPIYGNTSSSPSIATQQSVFAYWTTLLRKASSPIPVMVFDSTQALSQFYAQNTTIVGGLTLNTSAYPSYLTYDVKIDSHLLAAPIAWERPSLIVPSFGSLLGGASSYVDSGFTALQILAESTLSNLIVASYNGSLPLSNVHESFVRQDDLSSKRTNAHGQGAVGSEMAGVGPIIVHVQVSRGPRSELSVAWPLFVYSLILMIPFVPFIKRAQGELVHDRITKMKSYWEFMGMSPRAYWTTRVALLVIYMLPLLILSCSLTAGFRFFGPYAGYGAATFFLFALSCVAIAVMVGAISNSFSIANLWLVFFCVTPVALGELLLSTPFAMRLIFSFIAPINFIFVMVEILKLRVLSTMGNPSRQPEVMTALPDTELPLALSMFVVDTVIYIAVAIIVSYIRNRKPAFVPSKAADKRSMARKFRRSVFNPLGLERRSLPRVTGERASLLSESSSVNNAPESLSEAEDAFDMPASEESARPSRNYQHFEPRDGQNPASLRVVAKNVEKTVPGKDDPILTGVDLRIEEGIYVLVGPKGSGKSTLLSILSGGERPTSGTIIVDGMDLATQRDQIRNMIGFCPQENILSDAMSVKAHLQLIGRLKGIPESDLLDKVTHLMTELGLTDMADRLAISLSVGEKRALMLAQSLIVPTRIVFIDEATTGMSILQRKSMWLALMKRRKTLGTTFIVATSHYDDAEVLADCIGIMHRGQIVREGSLEFLTHHLGYQISIGERKKRIRESRDVLIPDSSLIVVPTGQRDELPQRLRELEAKHKQISISSPTLEQVLFQVEDSLDSPTDDDVDLGDEPVPPPRKDLDEHTPLFKRTPPRATPTQQLSSYLKYRIPSNVRNYVPTLCFLFLPLILTVIGLGISRIPGHSLRDVPIGLHKARATTDPMAISIADVIPVDVPYTSTLSGWLDILVPWVSAPNFQLSPILLSKGLVDFLWLGIHGDRTIEGGLEITDAVGPEYAYNVAYNQTEVYSSSRLINFMTNVLLRNYTMLTFHTNFAPDYKNMPIRLRSVPFAPRVADDDHSPVNGVVSNILNTETTFSFHATMSIAILGSIVGAGLVIERERGLVPQMRRFGMTALVYWIATLLWAFIRMTLSCMIIMAITAAFQFSWLQGVSFVIYSVSLFLMAWTTIFLAGILAPNFTESGAGPAISGLLLSYFLIPNQLKDEIPRIISGITWLQWLKPIMENIYYVSPFTIFQRVVHSLGYVYSDNDFSTPPLSTSLLVQNCGKLFIAQAAHFVFWALVFLLIERRKRFFKQNSSGESLEEISKMKPASPPVVTAGLPAHHHQTRPAPLSSRNIGDFDPPRNSMDDQPDDIGVETTALAVKARGLRKRFEDMPRYAVDNFSLSVPVGQTFGIIGPHISGKSTALHMLIGDVASNAGSIEISGYDAVGLNRNRLYNLAKLGVCLQQNSLFERMTVREHVELFLSLRNDLKDFDLRSATVNILRRAKLMRHADTYSMSLGQGPKRKLCVALAALTNSNVLLLDEPTEGCDAATRQTIWEMLTTVVEEQQSMVIATSNFHEAEWLCDKIAVLVNGQVATSGAPEALSAACSGYEVRIWMENKGKEQQAAITKLEDTVLKRAFPRGFFQVEISPSRALSVCIKYDIPLLPALADAFEILNQAANNDVFLDYNLTRITLSSAYHRLVRQQLDDYSRYVEPGYC